METDQAIEESFRTDKKPVFMSDAGDNGSAGALCYNTLLLKKFLERKDHAGKKTLFCAIQDKNAVKNLEKYKEGDSVTFSLGFNVDKFSAPVELSGKIKAKGMVTRAAMATTNMGNAVTLTVDGINNGAVDVTITDSFVYYNEVQQFEAAKLNWKDYDIIVVKLGYIHPGLKDIATLPIMALTPGATDQHTEDIPYKTIFRPMFPVDRIFY